MTTQVFGVFSQEDVNNAVNLLGEHGLADDYKIIDRYNLREEQYLGLPGQGTGAGSSSAIGGTPMPGQRSNRASAKNPFRPQASPTDRSRPDVRPNDPAGQPVYEGDLDLAVRDLSNLGDLSDEEATYFARSIFNGAALIVVEVDRQDEASEVEHLLAEAGAQSAGR